MERQAPSSRPWAMQYHVVDNYWVTATYVVVLRVIVSRNVVPELTPQQSRRFKALAEADGCVSLSIQLIRVFVLSEKLFFL